MGVDKGPDEPAPYCTLVIGPIAVDDFTAIMPLVVKVIGRQAAQAMWGQQRLLAAIDNGLHMSFI